MTLFGASCATPGSASNPRMSRSTGVPESKYVQEVARHTIVDVVTHPSKIHTTHAFEPPATRGRTHTRLRGQHRQHLGDIVLHCVGRRWSISCPPTCRLFDLGQSLGRDPDL